MYDLAAARNHRLCTVSDYLLCCLACDAGVLFQGRRNGRVRMHKHYSSSCDKPNQPVRLITRRGRWCVDEDGCPRRTKSRSAPAMNMCSCCADRAVFTRSLDPGPSCCSRTGRNADEWNSFGKRETSIWGVWISVTEKSSSSG